MTRPTRAIALAAAAQFPVRVVVAVQTRSTPTRATQTRPIQTRATHVGSRERGDVPGWVLVTLMSALIVVGLIATLQAQLGAAFSRALNSVSTP